MIYAFGAFEPSYAGDNHWIANSADIIGDVKIGLEVSIWWNAVVRADTVLVSTAGAGVPAFPGSVVGAVIILLPTSDCDESCARWIDSSRWRATLSVGLRDADTSSATGAASDGTLPIFFSLS